LSALHFESAGFGEPIIFIHGWGVSSAVWKEEADYFSKRFRAVTVDLPGHGKSAPVDVELTIKLCAELLKELMKNEGLEGAHLVGWSLGAEVAARTAMISGGRLVRSLVSVGGTPCYVAPTQKDEWGMPEGKAKYFQRQLERDFSVSLSMFIHTFFEAEKDISAERAAFIKSVFFGEDFPPDQRSAIDLLKSLYDEDLRGELKASPLTLPLLVCHGDRDMIVPIGAAEQWSALLSQVKIVKFENCGHAPFLTNSELFRETVENFITALG